MTGVYCRSCANLTFGWCDKKNDSPDENLERECEHYTDVTAFGLTADRIRELAEAEKEGRLVILPPISGAVCGTCGNFCQIPGTCRGTCKEKPYHTDRYGRVETWRGTFEASRSRKACKKYIPREAEQ